MPPEATLLAKELTKRFGTTVALDGVSLAVRRTECMALIGESGSGKTTLLRCFNRMTDPDSGRVLVDGADASAVDPIALRRRVGYVPQDGGLLPHWRVRRNVGLVPWLCGMPDEEQRAERALRLVGLEPAEFAGLLRKLAEKKFKPGRIEIEVTGGVNRPPLERTAGVQALFRKAQRLAAELEVKLEESSAGGGSDGKCTATMSSPSARVRCALPSST